MWYSRHDSGASREQAQIMRRAQDGSVHLQHSLPSSSYPARSTLSDCVTAAWASREITD